jgi:DNA-binding transcriptional LysR family regulator
MLDWNDLRFLLAVADHGGTKAAARELGVDPSTVQRRIMELERQVGQARPHPPIAERLQPDGLGERMLAPARQVAQAVALLEHR